jgi:hypothetical protein
MSRSMSDNMSMKTPGEGEAAIKVQGGGPISDLDPSDLDSLPRKTKRNPPPSDSSVNEAGAASTSNEQDAELAWAEYEASYRKFFVLVPRLSTAELDSFATRFQELYTKVPCPWGLGPNDSNIAYFYLMMGKLALLAAHVVKAGIERTEEEVKKVIYRRNPKPRKTARDDEVVRLRDEEGLEWNKILTSIRSNSEWAKNKKTGKLVTKQALVVAYNRRKKEQTISS